MASQNTNNPIEGLKGTEPVVDEEAPEVVDEEEGGGAESFADDDDDSVVDSVDNADEDEDDDDDDDADDDEAGINEPEDGSIAASTQQKVVNETTPSAMQFPSPDQGFVAEDDKISEGVDDIEYDEEALKKVSNERDSMRIIHPEQDNVNLEELSILTRVIRNKGGIIV